MNEDLVLIDFVLVSFLLSLYMNIGGIIDTTNTFKGILEEPSFLRKKSKKLLMTYQMVIRENFGKRFWNIVKDDISKVFHDFFKRGILNRCVIGTYICLVPKKARVFKMPSISKARGAH